MTTGLVFFVVVALFSYGFAEPLNTHFGVQNTKNCVSPPDPGDCYAYIIKFYYNPSTHKCHIFIYGGCKGNLNNFNSEEECTRVCSGNILPASASSEPLNTYFGVQNTKNNHPNCVSPPDPGDCYAYIIKFYYNPSTQKCHIFIYGGCKGNLNNFNSEEECMRVCSGNILPASASSEPNYNIPQCMKPPDPGPCYAYQQRYYYDASTKRCKLFIYGGCDGNSNNFVSQAVCWNTCFGKEQVIKLANPFYPMRSNKTPKCTQPPERGPCYASIPRYYFNPFEERCYEFTYGGCYGNLNNFGSEAECLETCPGTKAGL